MAMYYSDPLAAYDSGLPGRMILPDGLPGEPPVDDGLPDVVDTPGTSRSTTPTGTQADPWDVAPTDGNWQTWFSNNVAGVTPTTAYFLGLEPKLAKHGIKMGKNAAGEYNGKIVLPDGSTVDVVQDYGGPNMAWQWLTGSGSTVPADQAPISINPDYLAPWTREFAEPSEADLLRDPSYLFRLSQGRGVLENSAAARGLLNSGGTLTDILNYGQKAGSQEYGNVRENLWRKYIEDKDTWFKNQNEAWNKQYQAMQLGGTAASAS